MAGGASSGGASSGGGPLNTQALSLLASVNNHGDVTVKLSSLKQAKDLLLSLDPSSAANLFPYLSDLHSSPEPLVRLSLIQVIEEIALRAMQESPVLMSVLLALLRDSDSVVARQGIVSGTNIFVGVLEELTLQFHRRGKIDVWLEDLWSWMVKFKDAVFTIAVQPGSAGTKLLALKFLETYILLFTSDTDDSENSIPEGSRRGFNISWLVGRHPILDLYMLKSEANRALGTLLNLLRSAGSLGGSLTISIVNCLAAVARKRPVHYGIIVSALFEFDPNFEVVNGRHTASIQYSIRTAFLGFLRCSSPVIIESRDRLLRALRSMNAGDAADQVIRQVDKMLKYNERVSRDARSGKDDQQWSSQLPDSGDLLRKRPSPLEVEESANDHEFTSKRSRYVYETYPTLPVPKNDSGRDTASVNGVSSDLPILDGEATPVEQMITVIGALLAEGERGAESLEILVSTIHPDLLADIVMTNMRHLPKMLPPLAGPGMPVARQIGSLSSSSQFVSESPTASLQSPVLAAQMSFSSATVNSLLVADTSNVNNLPADSKRDPRRDPRRLDPRCIAVSTELASSSPVEDATMQSDIDNSVSLNRQNLHPILTTAESTSVTPRTENDGMISDNQVVSGTDQPTPTNEVLDQHIKDDPTVKVNVSSDLTDSHVHTDKDLEGMPISDVELDDDDHTTAFPESDQHSPSLSITSASEEICEDLPEVPTYIELRQEQKQRLGHLAVERIIQSYKQLHRTDCSQMRLALLARLVAQIDANDKIIGMLHKHIVVDYHQKKGHELVMHILYHLEALAVSDSVESSTFAVMYEKFLLAVAKCLLESFPASDKTFSRLLGEVPVLPDSALKLLDDLCYSDVIDQYGKVVRDTERVTQGLGAVWSLILGRPQYRQSCLDITLKCAVHPQDDIRTKGVRLVANKLYQLTYVSEVIEKFATDMLLSAVKHSISGIDHSQSESTGKQSDGSLGRQETSVNDVLNLESADSEKDSITKEQPVSVMSISEVQRLISLFFSLCTKKPSLIQLVFNTYGCAPQAAKQAFDRNIPVLIRALGSSSTDLLHIISDPPQGSENLLMLVLQQLTQERTPSSDLIDTVKHLYETKLKDVTILIPMLSSLTKNEVLPIFPRLVALPLDKFQTALAHILQGSAHSGPALTPAEVLVSIHSIVPDKEGLTLKKITDACSACFEQRTVFTQQVLAKALNQMVDQTPIPLLFMRTVIMAIDAFPSLVDFVMEILSKLVRKQVWRMPNLWIGFLKCASQTQPHSFHVFLQLPPPQLESALNKYANVKGPLTAYASQSSIKASISRPTLAVLGLANEPHLHQSHMSTPEFHPTDATSSTPT